MKTPQTVTDNRHANAAWQATTTAATLEHAETVPPIWPSTSLLQGKKTVAIEHNGALYHLQSTRAGKLILTK